MTDTIVKLVNLLLAFGGCFCLGFIVGVFNDSKKKKPKPKPSIGTAYCFECEIEMPVKVKYGHAFCSNCGLPH